MLSLHGISAGSASGLSQSHVCLGSAVDSCAGVLSVRCVHRAQVPESAKLAMVSAYVYLQEGNIAEGEQRINLAIRHALLRCDTPHGRSGGVVA